MLLALLDHRSDQVGICGFVAERLHDAANNSCGPAARKKYAKFSPAPPPSATE